MKEQEAVARYHSPMKPSQMHESFLALRREMEIQRFADRVGLPRSEVTVVVNRRMGNAFCQWIHAVPKEMQTRTI